jgi:hypothetical protein
MDNFIEIYNNAFSDEFCNAVIKYYNEAEKYNLTLTRQARENANKLDKDDSSVFMNSFPIKLMTGDLIDEITKVFWGTCYKHYADKYSTLHTLNEHSSYDIKVQKTKPGQGYHVWHCESTDRHNSNRILVWTIYLNDEFEAGETEFLYQQYRYKPQKGDCVIFPAAFTHTHRGNPPIGGDKYIITGWVEF